MRSQKKRNRDETDYNCNEPSLSSSVCINKIIHGFKTDNSDGTKAKMNLVFKIILQELNAVNIADVESLTALEFMINDFIDNINNRSETEKKLLDDFNRFVDEFHNGDDDDFINDIY